MPIKEKATKWAIMELLYRYKEGLNFNSIAEMMKRGKGFKLIKSRNTISKALKELMKEGCLTRDIDTRKYNLTEKGQEMVQKFWIMDEILACQYFDMYAVNWAYWKKPLEIVSSATYLIDQGKDATGKAVAIPVLRIRERGINWIPQIIESLKILKEQGEALGISEQSSLDEVWSALFKDVKRIIIVETLNPPLLLEKLKLMGISNLKELEEFEKLQQEKQSKGEPKNGY